MHLDTDLLLTAERLQLEPGLLRGEKINGVFAFKRVASQTYLVVNELQARVLGEFASPRSVPEVLEACIRKRSCPALRDFYDLILKAHRAGVLRSEEIGVEGPAAVLEPPVRWFLTVPAAPALAVAGIGGLATLTIGALWAPVLPATVLDAAIGWAATCAALSLGQILAASVLRGAGGELHRPRVHRETLMPHFAIDLSDTCMIGRKACAAAWAMTLLPLVLVVGAGLWLRAPWSFLPLAWLLFAGRPVGDGAGRRLLFLLRRRPLIDTDEAPLFEVQSGLVEQCRAAWRRFDGRVAALHLIAALAWTAAVGLTAYRVLHLDPAAAFLTVSPWPGVLTGLGGALAVTVLWWTANAIQYNVVDGLIAAWRQWSVRRRRWFSRPEMSGADFDAEALIRRNPLLRRLDPELQMELAQHVQPFSARAWSTIVAFEAEPAFVGLVLSGSATVYRRLKSGRKARFLRVMEGDLFGAHALVDPDFASLEIRATTPLHALAIPSAEFKRLVVDPLGAAAVRNYVHKHLFLQRASPVCAEWRPAAVARFTEIAGTATHTAGGKIVSRGQEASNLYVLYEGRARALHGGKAIGRIDPGDIFGEISLLQTSAATADVESNEDSRCLVVNRVEFIRFMSRNQHVALQMERLCSQRLGHPVFPLDDRSFEER
jgi:CRP-like cAMP-binding protein